MLELTVCISFLFSPAVKTILGLEEGKECIIVGTIYKHMKLKPSILDEYSKEVHLNQPSSVEPWRCMSLLGPILTFNSQFCLQRSKVPLVKPHNFVHPDDHLILEDESGRVTLTGSLLDPSAFVTGANCIIIVLLLLFFDI